MDSYLSHFDLLKEEIQSDLEKENEFLSTEISDSLCHEFSEWVLNYRRVGHENPSRGYSKSKLDIRKKITLKNLVSFLQAIMQTYFLVCVKQQK